ncbi:MAG: PhoH family protein, partial [Lachnospiraceae bacterium]|nr:PhoH family protein [Lachnospiraceae bacterium]
MSNIQAPKTFVLDTNILISTSGEAIKGFDDNDVIITTTTLEELDQLKSSKRGDIGYSAREAIRAIYALSDNGRNDLRKGVPLPGGGKFTVESNGQDADLLPAGMSLDKPDNRILSSTKSIARIN